MWRLPRVAKLLHTAIAEEVIAAAEDEAAKQKAIADGSYWRGSVYDDRDFLEPDWPTAGFGGGD